MRRLTVTLVPLVALVALIALFMLIAPVGSWPLPLRSAAAAPTVVLRSKFIGLSQPTHVTNAKDGTGRMFVVEKAGRIRVARGGRLLTRPLLDIRGRVGSGGSEQGLLSVAFPPRYATRRHFYVDYTNKAGNTVVSRFRLRSTDVADPASEQVVLRVTQPFANHNGGQLAFGPDGYLYIGMGDGGSAGDPFRNGQKHGTLLGKLLRIDVESGRTTYRVPSTNPFVGKTGWRPEIWALGLRNPWRFSFDRATRDLYIADVGQDLWEEIDFAPAGNRGGQNYGWNLWEADHPYPPGSAAPSRRGLTFPVQEYAHGANDVNGCSVTGGFVYRGTRYPTMRGYYFYGDFCTGKIWALKRVRSGGRTVWRNSLVLDTPLAISTFGEDEAGNIYVADLDRGIVYLVRAR